MKNNYITKTPTETKQLAKKIVSRFSGGEVVCLYGELGAGKTVFVQGMLEYFLPGKRVLSPTFIIVRHYSINNTTIKKFLHADLYRLTAPKEIKDLEFLEFINNPDTIVAIEWAEKLENELPEKRIDIRIENLEGDKRKININYVGS